MRISATGADRSAARGFTLVELLVVVAILGVTASVVVLAASDGRPSVAREAERFAARLVRAREEAVLTNQAVDVALGGQGYSFRHRVAGEWRPLAEGAFAPVDWSRGTTVTDESKSGRITFDETGGAVPVKVVLSRGERSTHVAVDSAGNVRVDAAPHR